MRIENHIRQWKYDHRLTVTEQGIWIVSCMKGRILWNWFQVLLKRHIRESGTYKLRKDSPVNLGATQSIPCTTIWFTIYISSVRHILLLLSPFFPKCRKIFVQISVYEYQRILSLSLWRGILSPRSLSRYLSCRELI